MGLLDNMAYDPQMAMGMGLLNAGGNSRMPVSLGQGLAQGWGNMQETTQHGQRAKLMEQEQLLRQQQMEHAKMQMAQMQKELATKELLGKALMGDPTASSPSPQGSQSPYGGGYSPQVSQAFGLPSGMPPPSAPTKQPSQGELLIAAARKAGDPDAFQAGMKMLQEEKKLAPKYANDVRTVMIGGKPTAIQMADDGTWKLMGEGVSPAEKLSFQDAGGRVVGLDPYTGTEKATLPKSMTPESKASNALGWFNATKQTFSPELGGFVSPPTGKSAPTFTPIKLPEGTQTKGQREDSDALRKEFTSLPQVKNYIDVVPIINAAKTAPDTPAGDFALIYGVGKILDPGSVVREGEMSLVIKSGSPAERVKGYLSYLQGKGRLTPVQREELTAMLSGRVGEMKAAYDSSKSSFEGIAKKRGYDPKDIFPELPEVKASQSASPTKIKGNADYDALPSGAEFIDPFGKLRRKP